jgi:hypothetical protein
MRWLYRMYTNPLCSGEGTIITPMIAKYVLVYSESCDDGLRAMGQRGVGHTSGRMCLRRYLD